MENNENLQNLINQNLVKPIRELNNQLLNNQKEVLDFFANNVINTNNKEKMLLNFRRGLEMMIKKQLFVTVTSNSTNKIVAVRKDNFLQLLDDRYYSELQLSTFLDIFKVETNNFKNLTNNGQLNEPHIKLVVNYILAHYNTTFRKFLNRNIEYYYMYKFFFINGEEIKQILSFLNSYHYEEGEENLTLYNTELKDIKDYIIDIYNKIDILFKQIGEKVSI